MKKIYILHFLLTSCLYTLAQDQAYIVNWTSGQADSVKKELRICSNDTLRMKMARSIGIYYQEIDRDTSLFYTDIQMNLAKKLHQQYWETDAYESAGWLLSQLKNYPLSIEYLLTGQRLAEDKSTEKDIWQLSFFSPKKDASYVRLTTLGFIHNDLSQLYNQTGDIVNELAQIRIGINIATKIGNNTLLGLLKSNLAQVKSKMNQPDSVIFFGLQSLDHMQKAGYKTYEGYQLRLMGDAYIQKGDFVKARQSLDQSVIANTVNRSIVKLPDAYFSYATMYKLLNQRDSSIMYLNKAATAFTIFNLPEKIKRAYGGLYTIYKELDQHDSAYHYLQLYQSLSDSLNDQEKKQIYSSQNVAFDKQIEQRQQESERIAKINSIRTYVFITGIIVLLLIAFLLLRNNTIRRKANILLQQQKSEIEQQKVKVESTLNELKSTQSQLIQSEKMASLGELTAGIAHEIQNPLNFVNNFSEVNTELIEELVEEVDKGNVSEVKAIANDIKENEQKINHHGKRADAIVKGMLQHSRTTSSTKEPTDINKLVDEYLRLAYHGIRAKDNSFNATLKTDYDESIGNINIIPQDIGRVILNLITNAFYSVAEKKKMNVENYEPTVKVRTSQTPPLGGRGVWITVSDNGTGIPKNIVDKIFQPFFTTKPTGQGTGLGLSLAYDIIKAHGGELKVETKQDEARPDEPVGRGTTFIIELPII